MEEVWRTISEFPLYSVSNLGRVRRDAPGKQTFPGRIVQPSQHARGYLHVGLRDGERQKWRFIHRLVAEQFVDGRSESKNVVNHLDGDKRNNAASNLEWCSPLGNAAHARENGLVAKGEVNGQSIATEALVVEIRRRVRLGEAQISVSRSVGLSPSTVSRIIRREGWDHVA